MSPIWGSEGSEFGTRSLLLALWQALAEQQRAEEETAQAKLKAGSTGSVPKRSWNLGHKCGTSLAPYKVVLLTQYIYIYMYSVYIYIEYIHIHTYRVIGYSKGSSRGLIFLSRLGGRREGSRV